MEKEKEKRQRAVPKFGSFRPKKATPEPEPSPRPASEEPRARRDGDRSGADERRPDRRHHERDRDRDRHRESESRHRHRERDRERDRERGDDRHRDYDQARHPFQRPSSPKPASAPASTTDLFTVDKRGDPLILQYGSNDRSKVPSYHRFLAGRVLGSPGFLTIHRDGAREHFSIRDTRDGGGSGSAFRDKALVAAANRAQPKRIRPDASDPPAAASLSADFIPFAVSSSRKRKRSHDDYLPIHPIHPATSPSPPSRSSTPSSSDAETEEETQEEEEELSTAKQRAIALSRAVKADPSDLASWLQLIDLQDALLPSSSPSGTRTADEAKALAQLRLALYEEALPHASGPAERERLLIGRMREAARVWDAKTLRRKWDEVAKLEGESGGSDGSGFGLWRERLAFELTGSGGLALTVEEGRALMEGKLRDLGRELRGTAARGGEGDEKVALLCGRTVYLLLRLTCFLRDTGFVELAVAAWQAVLELTFCRPADDDNVDSALQAFADFWESEVARIGEDGAKGWRHFVEHMVDDPPEPKREGREHLPPVKDPFEAWAAVERQRAGKARMPARTLDQGAEDDPFRVVMFSDIKEVLVWFPSSVLPPAKHNLVDAFLVFCGLPPAGLARGELVELLGDAFVAGSGRALELAVRRETTATSADLSTRAPEFKQQGGSMAFSQELLFWNTWFRYLDGLSGADNRLDGSWVLGTLKFLVKDCGVEDLAEYYLAMEWLNEPSGARKVAKGLLKQYSANIRLYNAYALVEWANQNPDVSYKVLSSATTLAPPSSPSGSQLLWNTWAWIHLEVGQKHMALVRLCASVETGFDGPSVSPALLLKARSQFSSTRDYSLSSMQLENALQHAESLALLEYLAAEGGGEPASETQGNITAALDSIDRFSRELGSRNLTTSSHHERLLQTAARLLYYHAMHGPYRPVYIREKLSSFVKLFPSNTIFLELFAWSQPAPRINDPVRDILRTASLAAPHDRLSTRRFAIRHEASRAGTAHSARAAFESALASDACRGSVELWAGYVRFCCRGATAATAAGGGELILPLRGRHAKDAFYRAIAACPWAKELYMEAFGGALAGEMGPSELKAVFSTMAAKGLRVHVDLEEFLKRWNERQGA